MDAPNYLDTLDDFDAVVRLQRTLGADNDTSFRIAVRRRGEDRRHPDRRRRRSGRLVGCVFSVPGVRHGRVVQWSHLLAVAPAARGRALGLRLKLAQRERALARGIDLIEWTCDPLLAGNARLNVRRLGCVVEAYLDDVYGPSTSPLHRGVPTDRFIASWHIGSPHVARRVEAGAIVARDASVGQAPYVLRTREDGTFRAPHGEPDLSRDEPRLRVEIPPTSRGCWARRRPGAGLAARRPARLPHLLRARLSRRRRGRRARRTAAVVPAGAAAARRPSAMPTPG